MVPLRPVAFVIYNHETRHYFTIIINYKLHHITTYGHHISSENAHYAQEPEKWGGQYIWKNICTLFNWELPERKPTYWAIDWKQVRDQSLFFLYLMLRPLCQNGYDCGPIAVAVIMVLFTKGPEYAPHPQVKKPHLECAHST